MDKFLQFGQNLLEKQGVGVLIIVVILGWMSGILPFKLFCVPPESVEQRERQQSVLLKVATLLERQTELLDRIDKREHIERCSRIQDKIIRDICLDVSLPVTQRRPL